jgi:hypothetical protein
MEIIDINEFDDELEGEIFTYQFLEFVDHEEDEYGEPLFTYQQFEDEVSDWFKNKLEDTPAEKLISKFTDLVVPFLWEYRDGGSGESFLRPLQKKQDRIKNQILTDIKECQENADLTDDFMEDVSFGFDRDKWMKAIRAAISS